MYMKGSLGASQHRATILTHRRGRRGANDHEQHDGRKEESIGAINKKEQIREPSAPLTYKLDKII